MKRLTLHRIASSLLVWSSSGRNRLFWTPDVMGGMKRLVFAVQCSRLKVYIMFYRCLTIAHILLWFPSPTILSLKTPVANFYVYAGAKSNKCSQYWMNLGKIIFAKSCCSCYFKPVFTFQAKPRTKLWLGQNFRAHILIFFLNIQVDKSVVVGIVVFLSKIYNNAL